MTNTQQSAPAARKPLRILMVCSFPGWGGTEAYAVRLAAGLQARGNVVTFVCRPGSEIKHALEKQMIPSAAIAPRNSVDLRSAIAMAGMLRKRFDLIHAHAPREYRSAILAGRIARRPVILTRHDFWHFSRRFCRVMARASRIVAVSEAVRRVLVEELALPPDLVTTVLTGIDLHRFHPRHRPRVVLPYLGLPAEGPVFGMSTRLDPAKRCDTFLDAAAILIQSHPEVRFVVVGSGPQRLELERRSLDLGLGHKLVWAGFREDIPDLLPELTALALPSEREPFALTVLETMASGVPVIATHSGGTPELVQEGETGILFRVGDADALAAAMKNLVDNPENASRMGLLARRRAEACFDQERMLDGMEAIYKRCVVS